MTAHDQHLYAGRDVAPGISRRPEDGIMRGFGARQVISPTASSCSPAPKPTALRQRGRGDRSKGHSDWHGCTALQQIRRHRQRPALDPGMGNCGKSGPMGPVGLDKPH